MKGTFIVLGVFAAGCVTGWLGLLPVDPAEEKLTTYVLYAMMFLVGITIGSNPDLKKILKSISPKLLLLPLVSILGTLAFSAAASLLLGKWGAADCLAVGSGMAYYSLSSILISGYKEMSLGAQLAAELGTISLLTNIFREMFTLAAAPFLSKRLCPFATIASAGATAMDVSLPVILRYGGGEMLPAAVISGIVSDFSVPILVTFFCSL